MRRGWRNVYNNAIAVGIAFGIGAGSRSREEAEMLAAAEVERGRANPACPCRSNRRGQFSRSRSIKSEMRRRCGPLRAGVRD